MQHRIHGSEIEPFYFGPPDRQRFGCRQAAARLVRNCAVVLCYPIGPEYIRSHRAYRQLAVRLSRAGFDVLRFDYLGCGDSYGDFEQAGTEQWQDCISLAITEMQSRQGVGKVCVVGLRFGATLAMIVGAQRGDLDGMVLWNPVVDGPSYIRELQSWHKEVTGETHNTQRDDGCSEIVGYPFSATLMEQISRIDPLAISRKPANQILLLETGEAPDARQVRQRLENMDVHLEYQQTPGPQMWLLEPYQAVIPHQVLQIIVAWIVKVYA